jgi:hypothetical protein
MTDCAAPSLTFLLAGRARLTLVGRSHRFTYRVWREAAHYRVVCCGADVARVTPEGRLMPAPDATRYQLAYTALAWAWPYLERGEALPTPARIELDGTCGRCGRRLTDPVSVAAGLGPECRERMGLGHAG